MGDIIHMKAIVGAKWAFADELKGARNSTDRIIISMVFYISSSMAYAYLMFKIDATLSLNHSLDWKLTSTLEASAARYGYRKL